MRNEAERRRKGEKVKGGGHEKVEEVELNVVSVYLGRRCNSREMPSRLNGGCCELLQSWSGVLKTTT